MDLANISGTEIKEISGVNADMMGHQSEAQKSGRAMEIRNRQGMLVSEIIFDNFSRTEQIFGTTLTEMLRTSDGTHMSRIYSNEEIRAICDEANLNVDLEQIHNFATGRYGIKVEQSKHLPTARMNQRNELLDLRDQGVEISPIHILELSDNPKKDEIIADLRQKEEMQQAMMQQQAQAQALAAAAGAAPKVPPK
jgi:hypothetical protein